MFEKINKLFTRKTGNTFAILLLLTYNLKTKKVINNRGAEHKKKKTNHLRHGFLEKFSHLKIRRKITIFFFKRSLFSVFFVHFGTEFCGGPLGSSLLANLGLPNVKGMYLYRIMCWKTNINSYLLFFLTFKQRKLIPIEKTHEKFINVQWSLLYMGMSLC